MRRSGARRATAARCARRPHGRPAGRAGSACEQRSAEDSCLVDFVHCRDAVLLRIILISNILPAMPTRAAPSMEPDPTVEEFDLPCGEAVLAGTLAMMTGYSQALQAEHDPAQRLVISLRIA